MSESQATELVVVRHGETAWNSSGLVQGHLDSDLTATGRAQAESLGAALAGERIDALYSSDLGRAMQTAGIIGRQLGRQVVPDARLRERDLGIAQGMTFAQFAERHPEEYARFRGGDPDYVIPGGESLRYMYARVIAGACEIASRHAGERVAVVVHGGTLSALFRHTIGLDLAAKRRYWLPNASINRFWVGGSEWGLISWGEVGHLRGMSGGDDL
jgi:probable phosphoglycerate mutase